MIWATEINGLSAKDELGPRWQYQPKSDGPKVEFAALGAGEKQRPGLAHVAIDWDF